LPVYLEVRIYLSKF